MEQCQGERGNAPVDWGIRGMESFTWPEEGWIESRT